MVLNTLAIESGRLIPLTFSFLKLFSYSIFCLAIYILAILSVSTKNLAEVMTGIVLNLFANLGSADICTNLSLPIYGHNMSSHLVRPSFISFISIV